MFCREWYEKLLLEGEFGPVRPGSRREDVVEALGPPEGFGGVDTKKNKLISYDDDHFRVMFHCGRAMVWGVYFSSTDEVVRLDGLQLYQSNRVEELRSWMRQRGVESTVTWDEDSQAVEFENGVSATTLGEMFYCVVMYDRSM